MPELSEGPAQPGPGWPSLSDPPTGRADARADAALVIALEDPALGGRPGAWEVASGWARYLHETRGLPAHRLQLLRDADATLARVRRGLATLERRAAVGGNLWLIFIGSASSPRSGPAARGRARRRRRSEPAARVRSYYNADLDLRAGYRYGLTPHSRMSIIGFRCAR